MTHSSREKYSVPFDANESFLRFYKKREDLISSVYFAHHPALTPNARVINEAHTFSEQKHYLEQISKTRYLLLNGRFTELTNYLNDKTIRTIENFYQEGLIEGVVFLDFYMLTILSKGLSKECIEGLDFIPSINMNLDSPEKVFSTLEYLEKLGFKKPTKITLDRSLNRNFLQLKVIADLLKEQNIKTEVLLNEGCLYNCPYKINHDVIINMANNPKTAKEVLPFKEINKQLGCIKFLSNNPENVLKIPFIRPEDLHNYKKIVDVFKISGRTHGPDFCDHVLEAYENEKYEDNLLDLLDASKSLREQYVIYNDTLKGFHEKLAFCDKICSKCDFCEKLASHKIQDTTKNLAEKQPE